MTKIYLSNNLKSAKLNEFLIGNVFNYPATYVAIFLHLNALVKKEEFVELESVAKKFNVVCTDVFLMLERFNEAGLLFFAKKDSDIHISFSEPVSFDVAKPIQQPYAESIQVSSYYSPEDIKELIKSDRGLEKFYQDAKSYFDYEFSHSDYEKLLTLHDVYKLPLKTILFSINHCKCENRLSMGELERTCKFLNSNDAYTEEEAKQFLRVSGDKYTSILNALGIKGKLKPVQENTINSWYEDFAYSMDIILEACDKAVINTNNPNINYVGGILKNWYNAGVTSVSDIAEHEKNFAKGNQKTNAKTKNSFSNFTEKQNDYDAIENLERKFG
ncbi:MAG: DnaD domain-containing protein [Lachnospirales bacterium]